MPMRCMPVTLRDGTVVWARVEVRLCACGEPHSKLCDHRLPNGKTCDRPLCGRCAVHVAPDTDYCGAHAPKEAK